MWEKKIVIKIYLSIFEWAPLTLTFWYSSIPLTTRQAEQRRTARHHVAKIALNFHEIAEMMFCFGRQQFSIFRWRQIRTKHRNTRLVDLSNREQGNKFGRRSNRIKSIHLLVRCPHHVSHSPIFRWCNRRCRWPQTVQIQNCSRTNSFPAS